MTLRLKFVVLDDKDGLAGIQTEVGDDGVTVVISKNGVVRELHLTKAHAAELDAVLDPWLAAGHQPGEQPEMPDLPGRSEAVRKQLKGGGQRREIPGTRDFYRELREWAAAEGIIIPTAGRRPGKQSYKYGRTLPRYLAHLEATAAAGKDGGVAAARLDMARLLGLPEDGTQDLGAALTADLAEVSG